MTTDRAPDYGAFEEDDAQTLSEVELLTKLADDLYGAETEVVEIEKRLKEAKKRVSDIAEGQIPELMDKIGMGTFTTTSGLQISINAKIRCSVPKANKEQAMEWLDTHGHGGLVKRLIQVAFNQEQSEDAKDLLENLRARFPDTKQDRTVHPQTLAAFIREQVELGVDFPMQLFGAWEQRIAKVKVKS